MNESTSVPVPRSKLTPRRFTLFALGGLLLLIAGYVFVGIPVVRLAYEKRGPEFLNRLVTNSGNLPFDEYLHPVRARFTRVLMTYGILCGLVGAYLFRDRLRRRLYSYFYEIDSPVNLAVFRIVIFGFLLTQAKLAGPVMFASLPSELRAQPESITALWGWLPFDARSAEVAVYVLGAASLMAMLGLFTRVSAAVACLATFYVFGIPQAFGKVNHIHHLLWFSAVLAASRCGDALSLDALLFRRNGTSLGQRWWGPPADRCYALPFRFIWLLMGMLYFFPGFWKLWTYGYEWCLADNMRYHLYHKWATLGYWVPPFRVDQHPLLLSLAGVGTVVFEMGFIFMMFTPITRWIAMAAGLSFHNFTGLFMQIPFTHLQIAYVSFVPWDRLLGLRKWRLPAAVTAGASARGVTAVTIVGTVLLAANFWCGIRKDLNGWPFACYPLFDYNLTVNRSTLEMRAVDSSGAEHPLDLDQVRKTIPPERLEGMLQLVLVPDDPAAQRIRAQALVGVVWPLLKNDTLRDTERLRLYSVVTSVDPAAAKDPPSSETLLDEWPVPASPPKASVAPEASR